MFAGTRNANLVRTFFGYRLHLEIGRGITHQLAYLVGESQLTELEIVKKLVRPGMRVVDVGANIGCYLLLLERLVGERGKVTCIEPGPENLIELDRNIKANGFCNVVVHPIAVGASAGEIGIRGGVNAGVSSGGDVIATVPIRTLSETVEGNVDFVKIDVEGFEVEVLVGASDLMRKCLPTMLVEVHPLLIPRYGGKTSKVIELLRSVYPHVSAFVKAEDDCSRWRKLATRYGLTSAVRKVDDLDNLFGRCDRGEYSCTFWVVASGSKSVHDALLRDF